MSTVTTSNGLSIVSPTPTGIGGALINNNFVTIGERLTNLENPLEIDFIPTGVANQTDTFGVVLNIAFALNYQVIADSAMTFNFYNGTTLLLSLPISQISSPVTYLSDNGMTGTFNQYYNQLTLATVPTGCNTVQVEYTYLAQGQLNMYGGSINLGTGAGGSAGSGSGNGGTISSDGGNGITLTDGTGGTSLNIDSNNGGVSTNGTLFANTLKSYMLSLPTSSTTPLGTTTVGFTDSGTVAVHASSTFKGSFGTTGYTISDVVTALKSVGIIKV